MDVTRTDRTNRDDLELRWRSLHESLQSAGAPERTTDLAWARFIPYAVVRLDRAGADMEVVTDPEMEPAEGSVDGLAAEEPGMNPNTE